MTINMCPELPVNSQVISDTWSHNKFNSNPLYDGSGTPDVPSKLQKQMT